MLMMTTALMALGGGLRGRTAEGMLLGAHGEASARDPG